jgi:hypothetical protein
MNNILSGGMEDYYKIPAANGTHAYDEDVELMLYA